MQRLTRKGQDRRTKNLFCPFWDPPIGRVTNQGMAYMGHVYANLVGSPCHQVTLDQRNTLGSIVFRKKLLDNPILGNCRSSLFCYDSHFLAVMYAAPDIL